MSTISHVPPDDPVRIAFDSLRERVCVLDRVGLIVLTNQAWDRFAHDNGARLSRCGAGVNYLEVCRTATGRFSEGAAEAASGIRKVLIGAGADFALNYPCPSPSQKAWFRLIARPLYRSDAGAVVSHAEITRQVLLAEKLRQTQRHYGALLENPVDVATVVAADGTIRYQSPASEVILGHPPEELAGHPIFEFVHPDDSEAVRKLLRDCLRYPNLKHPCEYRFRDREGGWRRLESIARNLISDPQGGIILNTRDIAHRKLAEPSLPAKQDAPGRAEELQTLVARMFREREEERRRAATILNGNLSQRLASLSLQAAHMAAGAAALEQSRALQECIASLGHNLHNLADSLYPAILDHFGLAAALRDCCAEFTSKQGIPVSYVHRGISARLPVHTASVLYRIAEDALANVARHARASQVWVTLSRTAKGIRLAIRDDGAGFETAAVEPGSGLGILAMRERLRAVRGSLSIRSRPSHGTEVVALAPLSSAGNQPGAAIPRNVVVDPLDQH